MSETWEKRKWANVYQALRKSCHCSDPKCNLREVVAECREESDVDAIIAAHNADAALREAVEALDEACRSLLDAIDDARNYTTIEVHHAADVVSGCLDELSALRSPATGETT